MVGILSANTLIVVFLVIALGTVFGAIKFGPIKFGAAGALFIGLAFGAFVKPESAELTLLQNLGLGVFVYLIGLEAGEAFFKSLRSQFGLMAVTLVSIVLGAVTAVAGGALLGLENEISVGAFAGSLTSTPSLSLAQDQTGSSLPAVGYSIGYPTGIVVAILLVIATIGANWKASKDQDDSAGKVLRGVRIKVTRDISSTELDEDFGGQYVIATVRRKEKTRVVDSTFELYDGDEVYALTTKAVMNDFVKALGHRMPWQKLRNPRVTVQRYNVSNLDIAGNTIGNIPLFRNYYAQILRIRRGDEEILATDDTYLAAGDVVEVVHPTAKTQGVENYLGNSVQAASELDWLATALGLFAGYLLAIVPIPLPGDTTFEMGAAGGPLIIGLILGALQRTGRLAWKLPAAANFTLRQFGLMVFLASVGVASGPAFADTAFSMVGLKTIILAALVGLVGCGSLLLFCWWMGRSPTRSNGAVAGLLGQPAVLQYAMQNSSDSRIMAGYSTTFAIALIFKIMVVPFML